MTETVSLGQVTDCHQIVNVVSSFLPGFLTRLLQFVEAFDCRMKCLVSGHSSGGETDYSLNSNSFTIGPRLNENALPTQSERNF